MVADADLEAARERVAKLPIWFGSVDPKPLGGGITNRNFVIEDRGRRLVARVGGDILYHGVVRANELQASKAAHAAGLSPGVVYFEPGVLVIEFIEGATFKPEDVRKPENLTRLVEVVRRCHQDVPKFLRGPAPIFWPFHVVRDYAHTLREARQPLRAAAPGPAGARRASRKRRRADRCRVRPQRLLAANILDDGKRLWLLDWEYAGFNSPLFDLGGLASNSELSAAHSDALLEAYFGRPLDDDLRLKAAAMTAASLLRETLWAMVSEVHSTLAFDYAAYTAENLARFEAAYANFETRTQS